MVNIDDVVTVRFKITGITKRRLLGTKEVTTDYEVLTLDVNGNPDLNHIGQTFTSDQILEK